MKHSAFLLLVLASGTLPSSCSEEAPFAQTDFTGILENTAVNVIVKTYESLATEAAALENAAQALANEPSPARLDAAKITWVAARSPWEESEGFLFGPVEQEGLDPSMDSWPVNVTDLDNVLASTNALTVSFLAQQEGTLKGFHTIEYLLWGESGNKTVTAFTTREFEYLAAACGALAADAQQLHDLWRQGGGNYAANIIEAGSGSPVYISQKSALEEIGSALIIIADEVANGKINDPFVQGDLTLEESRFSANSKADFADNMRSIWNVYTGQFEDFGNGSGLSDIIADIDPDLDDRILNEIDAAVAAIESIPATFSEAIFSHPDEVVAAQVAVRNLQATLEEQALPILSNL